MELNPTWSVLQDLYMDHSLDLCGLIAGGLLVATLRRGSIGDEKALFSGGRLAF